MKKVPVTSLEALAAKRLSKRINTAIRKAKLKRSYIILTSDDDSVEIRCRFSVSKRAIKTIVAIITSLIVAHFAPEYLEMVKSLVLQVLG